MLPERLRGQETSEYLRLWPRWVHPYFKSYEEVEWRWKPKFEKEGVLFLPWEGYSGQAVVVVEKKKTPLEFATSEALFARVDTGVALGIVRDPRVVGNFSEWRWEEEDGDGLCKRIRSECEKDGLWETGIIIVNLCLYFPRHGWMKFG